MALTDWRLIQINQCICGKICGCVEERYVGGKRQKRTMNCGMDCLGYQDRCPLKQLEGNLPPEMVKKVSSTICNSCRAIRNKRKRG